jgi:hypothetical protein
MTEDEALDLLEEIEGGSTDPASELEKAAAEMRVGEPGRALLLVAAGQHWQMGEDYDGARRCFLEARADGGESNAEAEANLLSLALREGDQDAAARQLTSLKVIARREELSPDECTFIAEALEQHGRLQEAHRWFTMPLTWADEDHLDYFCLVGRRRVREALGLGPDRFDALAAEEHAARYGHQT